MHRHELLAFELAAGKVCNFELFDLCEDLGLGPADFAFGFPDATIDNVG